MARRSRTWLRRLPLACVTLLAACGEGEAERPEYRVLLLTGGDSAVVAEARQGVELALAELDSDSGGVGGHRVVLLRASDGGTAPAAAAVCQNAIEADSVDAILAVLPPGTLRTCIDIAWRNDIPIATPLRSSGTVCSENLFYLGYIPNQVAEAAVGYLSREGPKKFFLVGSVGVPALPNAYRAIEVAGGTIAGTTYLEPGRDAASVHREIAAASPDVVIEALEDSSRGAFYRHPLLDRSLTYASLEMSAQTARELGPSVENVLVFSDYFDEVQVPANTRFVEAIGARFGGAAAPGPISVASYDALRMLAAAADSAATTAGAEVIATLPRVKIEGPRGAVAFGPGTGFPIANIYVARVGAGGTLELLSHRPGVLPRGECS